MATHVFSQRRVLFKELDNAISQLWMVHAEALDFVQRKQDTGQKQFVLLLQRKRKAIDDRAQNFQQLGNAIESLSFVAELEKHVVDRSTNI